MVSRGHCSKGNSVPHYPALFLVENGKEGRRKEGRKEGGSQVSPGKRRSPLSRAQRGYAPIILCLIWFHGLQAATGISSIYSYSWIGRRSWLSFQLS